MRRLGLFAVLLSLVGLSTAVAASFDVQTEDIASFSTSIGTRALHLSGVPEMLPGEMAEAPSQSNSVNTKAIDMDAATTLVGQTAAARHHSWQTAPVGSPGLTLDGPAWLELFLNGDVLAQLFDCPATTGADVSACTPVSPALANSPRSGNEATVHFGELDATIASGRVLRLKIVNQVTNPQVNVQWGYKSNRPSHLVVSVVSP